MEFWGDSFVIDILSCLLQASLQRRRAEVHLRFSMIFIFFNISTPFQYLFDLRGSPRIRISKNILILEKPDVVTKMRYRRILWKGLFYKKHKYNRLGFIICFRDMYRFFWTRAMKILKSLDSFFKVYEPLRMQTKTKMVSWVKKIKYPRK